LDFFVFNFLVANIGIGIGAEMDFAKAAYTTDLAGKSRLFH